MSGAPHNHDEHDVTLSSDNVWEITSATTPAFNPEQIAPSEDGGIDPAMEAALSVAMEPDTDFTPYESHVAKTLDATPATDSDPPASVPSESDWVPIMEFTSADIFQHSPFGDILNSLRSLSLSEGFWPPTHHPLSSHCRRLTRHAQLQLGRYRRHGRRCRRRTGTSAHKALDSHFIT